MAIAGENTEETIRALRAERETYVKAGLTKRVAAVDEQLRLRGAAEERKGATAGKEEIPVERSAPPVETTEAPAGVTGDRSMAARRGAKRNW